MRDSHWMCETLKARAEPSEKNGALCRGTRGAHQSHYGAHQHYRRGFWIESENESETATEDW